MKTKARGIENADVFTGVCIKNVCPISFWIFCPVVGQQGVHEILLFIKAEQIPRSADLDVGAIIKHFNFIYDAEFGCVFDKFSPVCLRLLATIHFKPAAWWSGLQHRYRSFDCRIVKGWRICNCFLWRFVCLFLGLFGCYWLWFCFWCVGKAKPNKAGNSYCSVKAYTPYSLGFR